jgi:hypothetical protein
LSGNGILEAALQKTALKIDEKSAPLMLMSNLSTIMSPPIEDSSRFTPSGICGELT